MKIKRNVGNFVFIFTFVTLLINSIILVRSKDQSGSLFHLFCLHCCIESVQRVYHFYKSIQDLLEMFREKDIRLAV